MKIFYSLILILIAIILEIIPSPGANSSSLTNPYETSPRQNWKGKPVNKVLEHITPKDQKEFDKLLERVLGISLLEEKQETSRKILKYDWDKRPGKRIMRVYATSFGKPGNKGEGKYFKDGTKVRWGIVAAALPDSSAIGKWVEVRRIHQNGKRSQWVKMEVKDLGPWFRDDPYWKKKSKVPRAVAYFKRKKRRFDGRVVINPAGMDITPWGWRKMGISLNKSFFHSQYVEWRFSG